MSKHSCPVPPLSCPVYVDTEVTCEFAGVITALATPVFCAPAYIELLTDFANTLPDDSACTLRETWAPLFQSYIPRETLATLMGISKNVLSKWENGRRRPSSDQLERVRPVCLQLLQGHDLHLNIAITVLLTGVRSPWGGWNDNDTPRAWLTDLSGANGTLKLRDALRDPRTLDLVRGMMATGGLGHSDSYAATQDPASLLYVLHEAHNVASQSRREYQQERSTLG